MRDRVGAPGPSDPAERELRAKLYADFDRDPAATWAACQRGDLLLAIAEHAGVDNDKMLRCALRCVQAIWDIMTFEIRESDMTTGLNWDTGLGAWIGIQSAIATGQAENQVTHWEAHRLHAFADLVHGVAHIGHGAWHKRGLYPAKAVAHAHNAMLLAAQEGRAPGFERAEKLTAQIVKEELTDDVLDTR